MVKKPNSRAGAAGGLAEFCRRLPHATEDIKWGADRVFSVGGKMYAAFDTNHPGEFGFKCSEEDFKRLTRIEGIIPAPYAARFSWIKVQHRRALPAAELRILLRRSYDLVLACLPARLRAELTGDVEAPGIGARRSTRRARVRK